MNGLPTQARQRLRAELDSLLEARFRPLVAEKRPGWVLVAGGRADQRGLLAYLLRTHAYEVTEARNGWEVLRLASESSAPDLVIADFDLPGLDGCELARELQRETRDLSLLLLTSRSDRELPERCQRLEKPAANRAVLRAVAAALPSELVSRPAPDSV